MKLTKARLKEIIEEELGEVIRPRMSVGSSGLRPPGVPAAPAPEPATSAPSQSAELSDLFKTVVTTHKVAKADPSVPEHVVRSLNQIAGQIASLMSLSEEKDKLPPKVFAKAAKIRKEPKNKDMKQDQALAIAANMLKEDGHTDVPSARRKLKTTVEDAAQILQGLEQMEDEGELPSWWMGKVTLAADYLNKARDYILVSGD